MKGTSYRPIYMLGDAVNRPMWGLPQQTPTPVVGLTGGCIIDMLWGTLALFGLRTGASALIGKVSHEGDRWCSELMPQEMSKQQGSFGIHCLQCRIVVATSTDVRRS